VASRGIRTSRSMMNDDIARASELYAKGQLSGKIVKQLGFDNLTVLKAFRAAGVMIRPVLGSPDLRASSPAETS
jgi:hypothetical protein